MSRRPKTAMNAGVLTGARNSQRKGTGIASVILSLALTLGPAFAPLAWAQVNGGTPGANGGPTNP